MEEEEEEDKEEEVNLDSIVAEINAELAEAEVPAMAPEALLQCFSIFAFTILVVVAFSKVASMLAAGGHCPTTLSKQSAMEN